MLGYANANSHASLEQREGTRDRAIHVTCGASVTHRRYLESGLQVSRMSAHGGGRLVILSGPSCVGKSPLAKALARFHPDLREAPAHRPVLARLMSDHHAREPRSIPPSRSARPRFPSWTSPVRPRSPALSEAGGFPVPSIYDSHPARTALAWREKAERRPRVQREPAARLRRRLCRSTDLPFRRAVHVD